MALQELKHGLVRTTIAGEACVLHPEKVLFWPKESMLVVSDFHLGKSDHFRKNGIPMPGNMINRELARLDTLINDFDASEVLFLGDLFHSVYNTAWESVVSYIHQKRGVRFILVEGNHDIMHMKDYERAGLVHLGLMEERGPFLFAHDKIDNLPDGLYGVFGHLHPGVKLRGKGMQSMTLPCFFLRREYLVMPAFGKFTGLAKMDVFESDEVYVTADGSVFRVDQAG